MSGAELDYEAFINHPLLLVNSFSCTALQQLCQSLTLNDKKLLEEAESEPGAVATALGIVTRSLPPRRKVPDEGRLQRRQSRK